MGGVVPNAVDLRVFLAFGTVQTDETLGSEHSTYEEQIASTAIQ